MTPTATTPTSLIGKCLRRSGPKQRGKILESYAAEVVIAARILGPRAAGESLGKELFGELVTVTATPILKVVAMVESGEIPMTKEELLAVIQQDESAMRFYESHPWISDPTGKSAPPTKKGRKPAKDKMLAGWTSHPLPVTEAEENGRTLAIPTASLTPAKKSDSKDAAPKRARKKSQAKENPADAQEPTVFATQESRLVAPPNPTLQSKEQTPAPKRSPEQQAALERMKKIVPK